MKERGLQVIRGMIPPKTILVPTDFSEPSAAALAYAVELAEKLDARLYVVHAFELPLARFADGNVPMTSDMVTKMIDTAEKSLAVVVGKYDGRKVTITTQVEHADPREGVLDVAKKVEADLIVMGTHGRRGIARALIGSTAEAIVRTSTIPVLTVHETAAKRG